ncbi:MAG: 16S rRNA (cytidine(1402)-2'-O)-methyltransferase [Syntrophomonadaceae bacterium]|jgi:16S rRNA (cytidine1402-2'-O)-methyltransferase|nr:16S rRNA (cytidine(1402)-2'-O)-methyltransferase [Syntrophomonadaceae bacterium]
MGTLYICATPIGNLEDASIRLLKTLRKVDMIACEDTRQTLKLLNRYKIKKQLISYHEHSKPEKEDYIIELLREGKDIALVSDAGMPAISDPGERLVKKAITAGIKLEVIPGPSALIAALAISGIDTAVFIFEGFLPSRSSQRKERLEMLKEETRTIILYEAPHRLLACLKDIQSILGEERQLAVARELTKVYEEVKRGSAAELYEYYSLNPPRGEISIIIQGKAVAAEAKSLVEIAQEVEELLEQGMDKKEAFKMKAREYGIKKSMLYNYFVKSK